MERDRSPQMINYAFKGMSPDRNRHRGGERRQNREMDGGRERRRSRGGAVSEPGRSDRAEKISLY